MVQKKKQNKYTNYQRIQRRRVAIFFRMVDYEAFFVVFVLTIIIIIISSIVIISIIIIIISDG